MKPIGENIEKRVLATSTCTVEIRAKGDKKVNVIKGYAAVYGQRSQNLGSAKYPFFEVIEPGAFENVMGDDVRALFNHDENHVLARSKGGKGTLRLFSDDTGLGYEFEAPDTGAGRDLQVSMDRGDIGESSFAFSVSPDGDKWEVEKDKDGNERTLRTIKKGGVSKLFDVSPVTYPAYLGTDASVAQRSLEQFRKATAAPAEPTEKPSQPTLDDWAKRLAAIKR